MKLLPFKAIFPNTKKYSFVLNQEKLYVNDEASLKIDKINYNQYLLKQYRVPEDLAQDIKDWYNGYMLKDCRTYNPWSIVKCLNKFEENNPAQLREFLKRLNDLVDDFHPNIYLLDNVFKGVRTIEVAVLDELNKDKK